jgi:hypothetical protein
MLMNVNTVRAVRQSHDPLRKNPNPPKDNELNTLYEKTLDARFLAHRGQSALAWL